MIETATSEDAIAMAALHYLSHTTSFAQFASPEWVGSRELEKYQESWTAALTSDSPGASAWVARMNGEIVGIVRVTPLSEGVAQLISMHVHPEQQGRGIGRALMNTAMSFTKDCNYKRAELGVIQANAPARGLYESAGWTVKELHDNGTEGVPIAIYEWRL